MGILRTDKISGLETPTPVTGSVVFDGTGDYLSLASSTDFALGTDDWTVEWFAYPTSSTQYQRHFYLEGGSATTIDGIFANPSGIAFGRTNAWATSETPHPLNQWNHYALVHDSTNMRLYLNGVEVLTTTNDFGTDATKSLNIGYSNSTYGGYFTGNISNFRILRGTALYTSNFTVPTHALEVIGDTVLLCCNNPDSAGADGTGKTITVNGDAAASTVSPGLTRDFTGGTEFSGVTVFDTQGYFVPPSGTTEQRGRGRGLFGGAMAPSFNDTIDLINIPTMGNSVDFGDIFSGRYTGACSSSTRAVFGGGEDPSGVTNVMDFVTIATNSDAIDFGDLTQARRQAAGCSSQTRGLFGGGSTPTNVDTIDFITIASIGDATDFGNLTVARRGVMSCSSPVRGVWAGGIGPGSTLDVIDYVTISTAGNALDFGNLTTDRRNIADGGCSNQVRGVFAGGRRVPANANSTVIDYITIASTGNAQDFGDITTATAGVSACSTLIRGVFAGGYQPTIVNTMEYVTIASTGNAQDFGDLTITGHSRAGCSDSHGGIS
jgi:hypothetical protein